MSLTYNINNIGLKGLPWGTLWIGLDNSLNILFIFIVKPLFCKKLLMHLIRFISNPNSYNLGSSPLCHTWLNAFSRSKSTTVEIILLLKFCLIDWVILNKLSLIFLFFLKPCYCKLKIWLFSAHFFILFVNSFSKILPIQEVRLNGL